MLEDKPVEKSPHIIIVASCKRREGGLHMKKKQKNAAGNAGNGERDFYWTGLWKDESPE